MLFGDTSKPPDEADLFSFNAFSLNHIDQKPLVNHITVGLLQDPRALQPPDEFALTGRPVDRGADICFNSAIYSAKNYCV